MFTMEQSYMPVRMVVLFTGNIKPLTIQPNQPNNLSNDAQVLAALSTSHAGESKENSLIECQYQCSKSEDCSGVTYDEETKTCTMGKEDQEAISSSGLLSVSWAKKG